MTLQTIHNYLKTIGKKGGKARAKTQSKADLSSQARKAVLSRWMRKRFKTDRFRDMNLPGWDIIDSGLQDLTHEDFTSVNALAVAELSPRLRFLGVPVPDVLSSVSDVRTRLYHKMEELHADMAHARFCALLERADSFCDALASIMPIPEISPHRGRRWCA